MPEPVRAGSRGTLAELVAVSGLGLASLTAYGAFFYAFGVLVEAIELDTGWSASSLGATYAAATLLVGLLAAPGGRALDRHGASASLLVGGVVGGGLLTLAASATSALGFAAAYGLGGGIVGALGFYHVTMAASARVGPVERRPRNLAILTIWGAFASAIYLPACAWLVERDGWRVAQRAMGLSVVASFAVAAWLGRGIRAVEVTPTTVSPTAALRLASRRPVVRRLLAAEAVAGVGIGILLVQQVPAMVDAGLAFTTAAAFAGARGFLQLLGRIPLAPVVRRTGTHAALVGSLALVGVSGVLLLLSGSLVVAGAFAVVAGVALGGMSPLSGLYAQELFDPANLGTLMGARAMVRQVFWALGPLVGGVLVDRTGGTTATVWLVVASGLVAAVVLARPVPPDVGHPDAGHPEPAGGENLRDLSRM